MLFKCQSAATSSHSISCATSLLWDNLPRVRLCFLQPPGDMNDTCDSWGQEPGGHPATLSCGLILAPCLVVVVLIFSGGLENSGLQKQSCQVGSIAAGTASPKPESSQVVTVETIGSYLPAWLLSSCSVVLTCTILLLCLTATLGAVKAVTLLYSETTVCPLQQSGLPG